MQRIYACTDGRTDPTVFFAEKAVDIEPVEAVLDPVFFCASLRGLGYPFSPLKSCEFYVLQPIPGTLHTTRCRFLGLTFPQRTPPPPRGGVLNLLTLLKPQSRFGDNSLKFQVVCPHNGTALLTELTILGIPGTEDELLRGTIVNRTYGINKNLYV